MRTAIVTVSTLVLVASLATFPPRAQDKSWSKSDGDFVATLTLEPAEEGAALPQAGPGKPGSATFLTPRGARVFAAVTFSGCARTEAGSCDVTARFTTISPEGKPLGEPKTMGGPNPNAGGIVQMSGKLGAVLEPGDALGVFKVRVEVADRVAKKQLLLEREFTTVEGDRHQ